MIERDSIRFGDTTIEYQVRRSERRKKTVQVTIDGGGVQVAAPMDTPADDLQTLVRRRAPWILNHATEGLLAVAPKRFVSGETLPYLGRNVRMVFEIADVRKPEVRFDHWRFNINVPRGLDGDQRCDRIRKAIIAWYRARAAARLPAGVKQWLPRFGGGPMPDVLIRDQRQRWGSCASDGTLRFNWRVVMLEPALVDYVVVHELAHLTVRNHSDDYWKLVVRIVPDAQERRRKLRDVGRALPL
ncbi:MAG: SprT family zinc-dependent metalloprotease [Chloroflexi bacterium]|nr:SprT family zinc-dependent metalloprotease [Chloroflexota bacterium]